MEQQSPGIPTLPEPQPQRASRRIIVVVIALSILVVGAMVAIVVALWAGSDGVDHPSTWDPQVADLVAFIEDERGRPFEHPVHVNFLSEDDYRSAIGGDEPMEDELESAVQYEGVYRSLGLLEGEQDLMGSVEAVWAEGTAAFYDTVLDEVFVNGEPAPGEPLDPELRLTVVHELTHAWQDQHTDAGDEVDEDTWTTDRSDALLAVLEGDATLMEWAYAAELDDSEFDQLVASTEDTVGAADEALDAAGAGDLLPLLFSLPYGLGPPWVQLLLEEHGIDGLLDALGPQVPTTASVLGLDIDGPAATEVPEPRLRSGATELERDTWGAFSWVVPLAGATDADAARRAVVGWAGDSVLISEDADGRVCVDASVALVDGPAADAFGTAADEWIGQLPEAAGASISRDGQRFDIHTCDPGVDATVKLAGDAPTAIGEIVAFNEIVSSEVSSGASLDSARCLAEALMGRFGAEALADGSVMDHPEFGRFYMEAARAC